MSKKLLLFKKMTYIFFFSSLFNNTCFTRQQMHRTLERFFSNLQQKNFQNKIKFSQNVLFSQIVQKYAMTTNSGSSTLQQTNL